MPRFRIHRIKQSPGEAFRWAAHTGGLAIVKERDYEPGEDVESHSIYAVWKALAGADRRLVAGDLIEDERGKLYILKYIGFEPAQWFVPEAKVSHPDDPISPQQTASFTERPQLFG